MIRPISSVNTNNGIYFKQKSYDVRVMVPGDWEQKDIVVVKIDGQNRKESTVKNIRFTEYNQIKDVLFRCSRVVKEDQQ